MTERKVPSYRTMVSVSIITGFLAVGMATHIPDAAAGNIPWIVSFVGTAGLISWVGYGWLQRSRN